MTHPAAKRRIAAILLALASGPLNTSQVAGRIALCAARTHDYMTELVSAGLIHIARWAPRSTGRQHPIEIYKLGAGRNARKPTRQTGAQRQAAMRKRVNADQDRRDLALDRQRTWKRTKRASKKPQSWLSALGMPT